MVQVATHLLVVVVLESCKLVPGVMGRMVMPVEILDMEMQGGDLMHHNLLEITDQMAAKSLMEVVDMVVRQVGKLNNSDHNTQSHGVICFLEVFLCFTS